MATPFGLLAFEYPSAPHVRRHGPRGYLEYQSFKPWLRDEFVFRCVFCLIRERWFPDGQDSFGVDHHLPKSSTPARICDYENLLYLCNRCNAAKQAGAVLDPCSNGLGDHLRVDSDGSVVGLTLEGERLIDVLHLNYASAKRYRRRKIDSLTRWNATGETWALDEELAFPEEMPQLAKCRCENTLPAGIESSYFELRKRSELPDRY